MTTAKRCLLEAVRGESNQARHRTELGIVLAALDERGPAAEHLSTALRLDPADETAARYLADVLSRGVLPPTTRIDRGGLIASLAFDTVDRDLLAAASLHHLAGLAPLALALERMEKRGALETARELCLSRTSDALKDRLLLEVLRRGIVVRPDVEKLLTALRRVLLLELPRQRLADTALAEFAVALVMQCWLNEFVWVETPEETTAIEALPATREKIAAGIPDAAQALLIRCLYRQPESLLGEAADETILQCRPATFQKALAARLDEARAIQRHAAAIPVLGEAADETSVAVSRMYDRSPYPRWTSVPLYEPGRYLEHLRTYFEPSRLAFAAQPFEVLIAGCGTGRQAVSAALDYGPNATVLGLDITPASLGYAALMAERMQVRNLKLARADLNCLGALEPPMKGRFHVVECTGVLHHMADLFAAWRGLADCLAPGGIMLIGLYSAIARRNLPLLKREPDYPGPDASDAELREYRARLFARPKDKPGAELLRSRDVHSSSGFRDYFLHVSEKTTTLTEIAAFLDANGLGFRGFVNVPFEALKASRPSEIAPGSLARWAEWEAAHPNAFSGMYQFWCTRKS